MTTKTSAVFEAARETSIALLYTSADDFERTFPLGSQLPTYEPITELELDGFQVALVPFQDVEASAGWHRTRNGRASRLLLLPMTWKQL